MAPMTRDLGFIFRGPFLSLIPVGLMLLGCGSSASGKSDGGSGGRAPGTGDGGTGGVAATGGSGAGGTIGTGGAGAGGTMATGGSSTGGAAETGGSGAGGATGTGGGAGGATGTGGGVGGAGTGGTAVGGASGTGGVAGGAGIGGGTAMGGAGGTTCTSIKINEVLVATSSSDDEEFIELYNPCSTAVDLAGYRVVYRAATTLLDTNVAAFTTQTIAAGEFLVVASYLANGQRDLAFAVNVHLAQAGGVGIRNAANVLLDAVGYAPTGTLVNNGLVEGLAAMAPPAGQSIVRRPNGNDSNTNVSDFAVTVIPSPGVTNN